MYIIKRNIGFCRLSSVNDELISERFLIPHHLYRCVLHSTLMDSSSFFTKTRSITFLPLYKRSSRIALFDKNSIFLIHDCILFVNTLGPYFCILEFERRTCTLTFVISADMESPLQKSGVSLPLGLDIV